MHHIQLKILNQLLYTPTLNYAALRPKNVESNHFAYHLDQLIKAGLIMKQGSQYSFSTEGLVLADRINHTTLQVQKQPHIVTSVYITNDSGRMALFTHAFQPYLGIIGPPQGRTDYTEHVADAAARELFEKTGLQNIPLTQRGIAYIHATKEGQSISKILAHVFTGSTEGTPELISDNPQKGRSHWGNPNDYPLEQRMPGFKQIQALLTNSKEFFFVEIETDMNSSTAGSGHRNRN